MQKLWYLYNARIFLYKIFHIYSPHVFTSQFNFTQLTYYLVKWRSIKVYVRFLLINSLKYLTFSSARAVFGRPLPGFRSVVDPCSSIFLGLQIAFTKRSFQPFSGNFATIDQYPKPNFRNVSIRAISSYNILPITKVIGLNATTTWNIEEFNAYYNAMLHVNIK